MKSDIQDVTSYIINDVAVPAAKDTIVNMITNGANMLFKGEANPGGYSSRSNGAVGNSRVDYGRPYAQSRSVRSDDGRSISSFNRGYGGTSQMRYIDVVVETRDVAEDILNAIAQDTITYGMVPVRELYEMTGMPWTSADNDYGWSDVSSARIVPTRGGWKIMMPTPEFLGDYPI